MSESNTTESGTTPGGLPVAAGMGCLLGVPVYGFAMTLTMLAAPRSTATATIRPEVAMPWEIYACLPTGLAFVLVYAVSLAIPPKSQVWWRVGALIAIAACTALSVGLLRRDFIGKF